MVASGHFRRLILRALFRGGAHGVIGSTVRIFFGLVLATLCGLALASPVKVAATPGASVVFLNPGYSNEPFWVGYSDFMQAAADSLGMRLRVIYGERDPKLLLSNAQRVLAEAEQPDYLVFVNEMYTGPELLRLFADSPIKLFSLHSTLTPEQQALVGGTRERYRHWIGSLVPNDREAGYLMGKALIAKLGGRPGEMLAFSGVRHTPSATLREDGLRQALAEHPEVKLQQLVYGQWARQRAYQQAKLLLPRYPEVRLVWAANDEMAFGAMRAARELGLDPGRDLHFSALNNSEEVLQARISGPLCVLVGGHFTLGGWAMVLLHDHHAGQDFALRGGKDRVDALFSLLDKQQAAALLKRLRMPGYGLDFRQFSALYQPDMSNYRFSVEPLLR
ncbi:ABC transporter substrate-binding protein [Pseudomonas lalucatii]|uniref:ABC transporter substrate-binding protein n=1 Tax=Pseudomonas lalucatii TaxID=1424203 RepID=A0ABS5PV79_9PSED|nr:ABC transporter substrate-binding protein [Pseudomonas lalucatii]